MTAGRSVKPCGAGAARKSCKPIAPLCFPGDIPPTGPGEDYKPTPPGFVIADYRKALPCRSPETEF